MSAVKDFFFDPKYNQITAMNMHTILILMSYIGIGIGLISKKMPSSIMTVVMIVIASIVVILMNFLVRWLSRNNYENIAWGIVIVIYILYIVTGYNVFNLIYKNIPNLNRKINFSNDSNDYNDFNDFNYEPNYDNTQYSMPPHMQPRMSPQNYRSNNLNN